MQATDVLLREIRRKTRLSTGSKTKGFARWRQNSDPRRRSYCCWYCGLVLVLVWSGYTRPGGASVVVVVRASVLMTVVAAVGAGQTAVGDSLYVQLIATGFITVPALFFGVVVEQPCIYSVALLLYDTMLPSIYHWMFCCLLLRRTLELLFMGHDPTRGSRQEVFKISRVRSGSGREVPRSSRVESGRVKSFSNMTGRIGSGQELFKCHGSGRVSRC